MSENQEAQNNKLDSEVSLSQVKYPWRAPRKISIEMVKKTMYTSGSLTDAGVAGNLSAG